jgi:hypothetical protein
MQNHIGKALIELGYYSEKKPLPEEEAYTHTCALRPYLSGFLSFLQDVAPCHTRVVHEAILIFLQLEVDSLKKDQYSPTIKWYYDRLPGVIGPVPQPSLNKRINKLLIHILHSNLFPVNRIFC